VMKHQAPKLAGVASGAAKRPCVGHIVRYESGGRSGAAGGSKVS